MIQHRNAISDVECSILIDITAFEVARQQVSRQAQNQNQRNRNVDLQIQYLPRTATSIACPRSSCPAHERD